MEAALQGPMGGPARLRAAARQVDMTWPVWWLTFVSLTCYILAIGFGSIFILLFLLCWALYGLAWPTVSLDRLLRVRLPWAFPLLALASALWSQAPVESLRGGLQIMLATACALLLAQAQPMRGVASAFMCSLLASLVIGTAGGRSADVGLTGETALIGIFGSKNNLSMLVCTMMLAFTVVLDRRQPRILRYVGLLCGLLIGPALVVLGKSLGAAATVSLALGVFALFVLLAHLPARLRPLFLAAVGLAAAIAIGGFLILQASDAWNDLLRSAGKDPTLTRRVFIWQRAEQLIDLRPVFGVGFQAFWIRETVEAEGVWRLALVNGRFGFSFHNLYYETAVTLGHLGVLVLGGTLAVLGIRILIEACRRPSIENAFCAGLLTFFLPRAYFEVDFGSPFSLGSLVIPFLWVFATRGAGLAAAGRRPVGPA